MVRTTLLSDAVVSVEPAWKIKTAFGSPPPSSVRVPVSPIEEAELYTPGVRGGMVPRSALIGVVGPWPAALV